MSGKIITQITGIIVAPFFCTIGCTGVGRAGHQDGMLFAGIPGNIECGEQPGAVAHGNIPFYLIVILSDPGAVLGGALPLADIT